LSGLVRSTSLALLASLAAATLVHAGPALQVRRWSPNDPRVPEPLRVSGRQVLGERARAARRTPDVISEPGVDWAPWASRRAGYQRPIGALRDIRVASIAHGAAGAPLGPPQVVNVAFIRIDFATDRGGSASTGNGKFDLDPADTISNPVDRPPHNRDFYASHLQALGRYYDVATYGRVKVQGDVWPHDQNRAYTVSDMADFGPWKFGTDIEGAAVRMFHTFMFAADSQARALNDSIPWASIDRIVFIHAGSDLQSDIRQDSKEDIPSFTLGVADSNAVVFRNTDGSPRSRPLDRATFVPETQNQDGYYGALNGVIAHECGHLIFGFVDLYDTETGLPVVGLFSLMDSGNLAGALVRLANGDEIFATGLLPPSLDPFHRFLASDALDLPEIQYGSQDSLQDSERHPDMRRVTLTSDEFLVLENRYLTSGLTDSVQLDQDSLTRVVLGPKVPDRYEYDSLTPGGGVLIWHIDDSVIPFENSLRPNPDFQVNTTHSRRGVSVIEADGLDDIGDIGSPFILGSYRDPWYVRNNTVLSDDGEPNLRPNIGTRPHLRVEVQDPLRSVMRVRADRAWQLPGWPVVTSVSSIPPQAGQFPPGGPQLLAIDADGTDGGKLEVCWAGGDTLSPDSTALFAVRADGSGIGSSRVITNLDRRPMPVLAALPIGGPRPDQGPSLFAATTFADGPSASDAGGQVWLVDHQGFTYGNSWPASLPGTKATTPPIFVGAFPNATIAVGGADGRVYLLDLAGRVASISATPLSGPICGRLAVCDTRVGTMIAAGSTGGDVALVSLGVVPASGTGSMALGSGWPQRVSTRPGFSPDFLWLDFDGAGGAAGDPAGCGAASPELVVHDADRLWAFCPLGRLLPGWGRSLGDTLASGLGAGDADGDGFPEVLIQTRSSRVGYINLSGGPSPGWPKPGSGEGVLHDDTLLTSRHVNRAFPSLSPPLSLDVDGSRRPTLVALNASGIIAALRSDGQQPAGWPLATGSGVSGAPLAADLNHDGLLELVAPDRFGTLYAYALPADTSLSRTTSWTMLGGDPERTCALPISRTSVAPVARRGPVVAGSLKAYPNPARRHPVTIAYTLTEPAHVEVRILDTSGHQVTSFQREGRIAENLETWDPGAVPAGLYLVNVRFHSAGAETFEIVPVGVLK
jgi:M6 family metalloprotease-like protein